MEDIYKDRYLKARARWAWEEGNKGQFEEDFKHSQHVGCNRFGLQFIKAQEAALACFGGIHEPFDHTDPVVKSLISNIVVAVLSTVK